MKRLEGRAGVTLLELLIAVTLLAALSIGILFSLRVGLNAMEKTNARFLANRRVLGAQRILEQQIANLIPAAAQCMAAPGQGGPSVRFFQGEPQAMRFATTYSIQSAARGVPMIAELAVIAGAEGRGVRLVVNEIPFAGPMVAGRACAGLIADPASNRQRIQFRPIEVGPYSFVLADHLAFCRFLYREPPRGEAPEQWLPEWPNPNDWPTAVRVEMAPLEPDPARLQTLPLTVPVRVNRDPNHFYATW
jgi:type II secretory pathway pseudopilin PulG